MASLSEFEIIIKAATEQAEARIKNMARAIDDTAKNASVSWDGFNAHMQRSNDMMSAIVNTAKILIGAQLVRSVWEASVAFQQFENALSTVTGSSAGARESIEFVKQTADKLGLSIASVSQGYMRMASASMNTALEGQKTRDIFLAISEAASVMDLSAEQTKDLFDTISAMMSKGVIHADDLRERLGTHLPGAIQIMADALGVSTQKLNQMMESGQLLSNQVLPKFAAALHERFGEAAVRASQDAQSALNRFQNALHELYLEISKSGALDAATNALKALSDQFKNPELQYAMGMTVQHLSAMAEVLVDVVAKYGDWIAGIMAGRAVISTLMDMRTGFIELAKAIGLLNLVELASQFKAVDTAFKATTIGALAAAIVWTGTKVYELIDAYTQWQAQEKVLQDTQKQSAEVQEKVQEKLKALSEHLGINIATMRQFNEMVKNGTLIFNEQTQQWELSAQGAKKYQAAAQDAQAATNKLNAEANKLNIEHVFMAGVEGVVTLAKQISAAAHNPDWRAMLDNLDKISNEIAKLSGEQLNSFADSVKRAFSAGAISAQDYALILEDVAAAAQKKLGIDVQEAMTGVSQATRDAIAALDALAKTGSVSGQVIAAGFEKVLASAKSLADMSAVMDALKQLQQQGLLVGDAFKEAFGNVGRKAVDDFYKQLETATNTQQLERLRDDLRKLFESGAISSKQYSEAMADLNNRMKEVAVTQDMTHNELIAYTEAQKDAARSADQMANSIERQIREQMRVEDAVSQYRERARDATDSTDDMRRSTDKASDSSAEHARRLQSEAQSLQRAADAEQLKLQSAERHLQVLRQYLAAEQAKLQAMIASGTATQAEIQQQANLVQQLQKAVQDGQAEVEVQQQIAASARDAAQVVAAEAAGLDDLAGSIQNVQSSMQAVESGHSHFTVQFTDWVSSFKLAMNAVSDGFSRARHGVVGLMDALGNLQGRFSAAQLAFEDFDRITSDNLTTVYDLTVARGALLARFMEDVHNASLTSIDAVKALRVEVDYMLNGLFSSDGVMSYMQPLAEMLDRFLQEKQRLFELNDALDAMLEKEKLSFEEAEKSLDRVGSAFQGQITSLEAWIDKAQTAIDSAQYLDDSDLETLQAGIDKARDKLRELAQQAMDAAAQLSDMNKALQISLWEEEGNKEAIENQRYQDQLEKLRQLYEEAGELGKKDYDAAVAKAKALHDKKMQDIEAEKEKNISANNEVHQQVMSNIDEEKRARTESAPVSQPHLAKTDTLIKPFFQVPDVDKLVSSAVDATAKRLEGSMPSISKPSKQVTVYLKNDYGSPVTLQSSEEDYERFLNVLARAGMVAA